MAKTATKGAPKKPRGRTNANGEGTIFKRGRDGKYVAELMLGLKDDGKRDVIKKAFDKRDDAKDWLVDRLKDRKEGNPVKVTKDTVGSYLTAWVRDTLPLEVCPSTQHLYSNIFHWYIEKSLGSTGLADLAAPQIRKLYRDLLDAGKSPRTVQLVRITLNRAYKQAMQDGVVAKNPVIAAKSPQVERREVEPLDREAMASLLRAALQDRLHAFYMLALTTGMRRGELLGLRWTDVDTEKGSLRVENVLKVIDNHLSEGKPKTKASRRTITLPQIAIDSLRRWKAEQNEERLKMGGGWARPDLVFTSVTGTLMSPGNLRRRSLHPLLEKAGVKRIRPHDLRHIAATLMLDQGVAPRTVQEILGHTDIRTTLGIYGHVLPEQKKEAAAKVDAFVTAAQTPARKRA